MELISQCAIQVAKLAWQPGPGRFAFTVVCKATFELRPDLSPLAAVQDPVVEHDVYTRADRSSLARASEIVPFKKWPEVLLTGHAYAPGGTPVPSLDVRLVVGEIDKSIQVEGDRWFDQDGWITDPGPFVRSSLVWERAAGGPGTANPVGVTNGEGARPDHLGRIPAPNLVPVGLFLTSRRRMVPPVGFGPIAPQWMARASHLRRHASDWDPERWNERPLPTDIDVAYFNAAPFDQQRAEPFGEESLYLENLHPRHPRLSTRLAPVTPVATAERASGPEVLRLRCDTLVIDTDRGLASLVWRAHVLVDHADPPRRVIVTGPDVVGPSTAEQTREVPVQALRSSGWALGSSAPARLTLLDLSEAAPSAPALPFSPAASSSAPRAMNDTKSRPPPAASSSEMTRVTRLDPSELATLAPALPFSPAAPAPEPVEPMPMSMTMVAPIGLPTSPLPFSSAARDLGLTAEAVVDAGSPAPVIVLESAAAVAEDAKDTDLERVRLVQRAIWQGDRPARQILAEHGLTEVEWRAMKRASAGKLSGYPVAARVVVR